MTPRTSNSIYAVAFDMDTKCLEREYGKSYPNAYKDIGDVFKRYALVNVQGSVYLGASSWLECVSALQEMVAHHEWFGQCVRNVRVFRVEDDNDVTQLIAHYHNLFYKTYLDGRDGKNSKSPQGHREKIHHLV